MQKHARTHAGKHWTCRTQRTLMPGGSGSERIEARRRRGEGERQEIRAVSAARRSRGWAIQRAVSDGLFNWRSATCCMPQVSWVVLG
ncbi:hypothetical protein NDU88_008309 [Pleurodeles waltl]|uniref:Uncharacterized protein n=1 Tax=Pleurodeles waltl TaxID=8319 RepID=A0AAV7QN59_PLEWA|nr:hypothetical protein NDU88_008309 [Pleurodeles waltl]